MIRLLLAISLLPHIVFAEKAPEPEYPYPQTQEKKAIKVEQPKKVDSQGVYYYDTSKKSKSKRYQGVEQPYKVGSDGSYYYNTDSKSTEPNTMEGVEEPIDQDNQGGYYYKRKKDRGKAKPTYGEAPSKITKDGAYVYNLKTKPTNNVLSLRGGAYGPPNIQPKSAGGRDYSDVYGGSSAFIFQAEYDWELWGGFYLKAASGFFSATGDGQFVGSANTGREPKEKFNFIMFPNTLSVSYKFSIWNTQWLVPYVDGGLGYFTFAEIRSDGKKNSFGGAPVLTGVGGLMISIKGLTSGSTLSNDYGITDLWLDLQVRQVVGLDSRKDFSSSMITGGFALGFH